MPASSTAHQQARRRLLTTLLCACLLPAWAESPTPTAGIDAIYVIVATASPVETLDSKDLFDVYTGRLLALPGAASTVPIEHARGHAVRSLFYAAIGTATPAQVDSHWARLQFSGRLRPPAHAADEVDMLRRVKADPLSIGYVSAAPREPGLRVVLRLARKPGS